MLTLDEAQTRAALPFGPLVDALAAMFVADVVQPQRHHHDMVVPGEDNATLLLMPAWLPGAYMGVKMVTVFPGNGARGLPAIFGSYLLSSARTGQLLAMLDGPELTARRTAAASALAARYLARADAGTLLVAGTGRLSANLIEAHAGVRPIRNVLVWGRDKAKADIVAAQARSLGLAAEVVGDLQAACGRADIISTCTLSSEPLIQGAWLQPGTHLDLVGAFKPSMRESDDEAAKRASLFVDTYGGATHEAGDIVQPLQSGLISRADLKADLADLCAGRHKGRQSDSEITLFKSVGAALEDLAGAILAFDTINTQAAGEG